MTELQPGTVIGSHTYVNTITFKASIKYWHESQKI